MKRLVILCLFLVPSLFAGIPAEERDAIISELNGPITLTLTNGRTVSGIPYNVSKEQLQLSSAEGAGEIIFTIFRNEIKAFDIPGESYKSLAIEWMQAGEHAKALELMQLLYIQRNPILPMLPASESHFFILFIDLILDSPDPARAIGVSARIRPQVENTAALRALDDAVLESYHLIELHEEALPLARAWVAERTPYGDSALGYYVLGSHYLRQAEYETAIDLALQPIIFSSPIPTEKLAHCYALAISAALELRDRKHAAILFHEMKARNFVWPSNDPSLNPYLNRINQYLAEHEVD